MFTKCIFILADAERASNKEPFVNCSRKSTMLIVLLLLASVGAFAQESINESNWLYHPRIASIRAIVGEIDSQIEKGIFTHTKKEQGYDQPYKDVLREAFFDRNGTIRKFIRSGGSDDSAVTSKYYYDEHGHLCFAYILGGAVNGTHIQHRIYFDTKGSRIWEIQKLVEGPGYTFPTEWPAEDIVMEPTKLSLVEW